MFLNNNSSCRALLLVAAMMVCGMASAQQDFGNGGGPGGMGGPGGGRGGKGGKPGKEMKEAPKEQVVMSRETEKIRETIYCFGFAGSFQDSISYMTDLQKLDSVSLTKDNKFIVAREEYSSQLNRYFKGKSDNNMVCAFFYDTKKKKVEKKYAKLRKRYEKAQDVLLRFVPSNEFKFEPVEMTVFN